MTNKEIVEHIQIWGCDDMFDELCTGCPLLINGVCQRPHVWLAGYEQAQKDDEWQPIDTAPKDRYVFLGWVDDEGETGKFNKIKRKWYDSQNREFFPQPTHWKPQPKPPTTESNPINE